MWLALVVSRAVPGLLIGHPPSPALLAALACCLAPGVLLAQGNAPREVRNRARSAETAYERTARWLAPTTFAGGGQECNEIVGRFCLTFDSTHQPPARPERGEVAAARTKAISALRQYFEYEPGELAAAGPLVRLLVEDGRARDAVPVARMFALHTDSSTWAEWLPGYALHAAGDDAAAAQHFERALDQLDAGQRDELLSIEWLLDPAERGRVGRLDASARADYVRLFWAMADARLATAVNETWVQHLARHVEARLRARVPRVTGMLSWGRDLDQLTVRYGSPVARERVPGVGFQDDSYIEHFDTSGLALAPRALLEQGLDPPAPGERWQLSEGAPRTAYAIPSVPRIVPLAHQLTRLPRGDSMLLRIDAAADSLATGAIEAALLIVDRTGARVAERRLELAPGERQVRLELMVARDTQYYGAELHDTRERRLYRARYLLSPLSAAPLELSDPWLTEPLPIESAALTTTVLDATPAPAAEAPRALTDLQFAPEREFAVHAEVTGLKAGEEYEVTVAFATASGPPALARGFNWLGRRLGLVQERAPARVRWLDRARATNAIAINVAAPPRPGLYYLEVQVRAVGRLTSGRRLLRVLERTAESGSR